jgi:hypothetical protein
VFAEGEAMDTNRSEILARLPTAEAVRDRLTELTAEANLLKGLLRVFEQRGWGAEDRRRKQVARQPATTAS